MSIVFQENWKGGIGVKFSDIRKLAAFYRSHARIVSHSIYNLPYEIFFCQNLLVWIEIRITFE